MPLKLQIPCVFIEYEFMIYRTRIASDSSVVSTCIMTLITKNLRADLFYKIEITLMIAHVRLIPRMSEKNPKCMAGQRVDGDIEILEVFSYSSYLPN